MNAESSINRVRSLHALADLFFNKYRFPGSRGLSRLLSKAILPTLSKPVLCPTIYGFDMHLNPEPNSEIYDIYYLGFYEPGTLHVNAACLRPGDTYIDVGASIGLMSLHAARLVRPSGNVIAFEPTQRSFEVFGKSVEVNGFRNIRILKQGLANDKGTIPIYLNRACPSMVSEGKDEPFEMVEIDRLDDVLKREGISKVRMIKVDVEGFELEVLKGARELLSGKDAPILCIEYMSALIGKQGNDLFSFIKSVNAYSFYQLTGSKNTVSKLRKIKEGEAFRNNDNLFCFLDSHIETLPRNLFI